MKAVVLALVLVLAFTVPPASAEPRVCVQVIQLTFSPPLPDPGEVIGTGDVTAQFSYVCYFLPGSTSDPQVVSGTSMGWDYTGNCVAAVLDVQGSSTTVAGVLGMGSIALTTTPGIYALVPKNPCQSSPYATGVSVFARTD